MKKRVQNKMSADSAAIKAMAQTHLHLKRELTRLETGKRGSLETSEAMFSSSCTEI